MDVYRLEGKNEDLGFDDYFFGQGVSIVEWAEIIADFLPAQRLSIYIKIIDEHTREVIFKPSGEHYSNYCRELKYDRTRD
jgi:tRNA threonylcarbamoyladenosine biosynthesis protein TsaE